MRVRRRTGSERHIGAVGPWRPHTRRHIYTVPYTWSPGRVVRMTEHERGRGIPLCHRVRREVKAQRLPPNIATRANLQFRASSLALCGRVTRVKTSARDGLVRTHSFLSSQVRAGCRRVGRTFGRQCVLKLDRCFLLTHTSSTEPLTPLDHTTAESTRSDTLHNRSLLYTIPRQHHSPYTKNHQASEFNKIVLADEAKQQVECLLDRQKCNSCGRRHRLLL